MATAQIYNIQHYSNEIDKGFLELYLQNLPSSFSGAMSSTSLSSAAGC